MTVEFTMKAFLCYLKHSFAERGQRIKAVLDWYGQLLL